MLNLQESNLSDWKHIIYIYTSSCWLLFVKSHLRPTATNQRHATSAQGVVWLQLPGIIFFSFAMRCLGTLSEAEQGTEPGGHGFTATDEAMIILWLTWKVGSYRLFIAGVHVQDCDG